jgi:hypothetical protein
VGSVLARNATDPQRHPPSAARPLYFGIRFTFAVPPPE